MTPEIRTEVMLIATMLLQLIGLAFAVLIDNYIRKDQRKTMLVIVALLFTLLIQNYLHYLLTTAVAMPYVRTVVGIYGYSVRPVIIVLFCYVVSPERKHLPAWILAGVNALVYLTALFSHLSFYISSDNHFFRGPLGYCCHVISGVLLAYLVYKFANYLQGNMDSLSKTDPIPFTTELEHTKAFLELEQLRFREKLNAVYDLEATAFLLPTLTLQPIVENAVEHGVRENEDGAGTVMISSREYPDRWEISVSDDGPSFDPDEISSDGERHIGLQNVRERLRRVSGGELRIESAPGQGCRVTIELPKEAGGNDADIRH